MLPPGHKLEVIELGDELGFILPEDIVSAWSLSEGAVLTATAVEGGFVLVPERQPDIR